MNYKVGTAYDQNPARLKILVKRNKRTSRKRKRFLAGVVSTGFFCIVLAATRILLST